MRIGGLASGMDIDTLVGDLMKAERIPLDKIKQKKQILEWQRDQYRDMNKLLNELQTMAKDMNYEKTYVSKKTTSSNEGAVTATAFPSATSGTYKIKVDQLATAAVRVSKTTISADPSKKIDPSKSFAAIMADSTLGQFKTSPSFSGGKTSFDLSTYKEDGTKVTKTIEVLETDSVNNIITKINDSGLGIRAFYDATADKVVMERTVTGDFNKTGKEIDFTATDASFLTGVFQFDETVETGGTNAKFTYNGSLTVEPSTNEYKINNIQFNLKQVTAGEETITVQADTDAAFDNIVKFVNKYNEVIEKINGKLDEKRYRDYQPLSDEEKEAMEDKQIELWEEKAKSGLIRNDSILSSGINSMRLDFYEPLAGALKGFAQLTDLGIKTTSNYLDKGKLTIDEDTLKSKLAENPDAVYKLFATDGDGKTRSTMGIAERLVKTIDSTIKKIEEKAGKSYSVNNQFTIGRQLDNVDNQIERFEDRLTQIEDRYWRQFTAMEKAIQQSNSQSMYLMQQFGGGM